jgi:hypothetical protein
VIREIWTTTPPAVYALGCILLVLALLAPVLIFRAIERSRHLMQDQIDWLQGRRQTLEQTVDRRHASTADR